MDILVTGGEPGCGTLFWNGKSYPCALGRAGVLAAKREGDGATPAGSFAFRHALWRPDRWPAPPLTRLPLAAIGPDDGWCDDPGDPAYNRAVRLPHPARHERMWRDDALYDLVIGHNDDPPLPGAGSAIFVHVARPDFAPTEGCVGVARELGLALISALGTGDRVCIRAAG